ncbi:hypothetical protein [Flavitalea sp.]|nr:hypothetical protein [Flavitalea sp.]
MKPVLIFLTLLTLSLSIYFTIQRFDRHGVSTMRIFDGTNDQELSTKGKIIFNEAETAVESISPNGFLKYKNNDLKLKVELKEGQIVYQLTEDGKNLNVNEANGKRVLAETIKAILETGFDARGRVERLYKKGGVPAVMAAAGTMQQDYTKAIYYDYLINTDTLSNADLLEVIKKTATIEADFEKAKLLRSLSGQLNDSVLTVAYLDVVDGMDADYEKAGVLKHLIKKSPDSLAFQGILRTIAGMNADHEKTQVLNLMIKQTPLDSARAVGILAVVKGMGADFEKNNLLKQFSEPLKDSATAQAYLQVVNSMDGDFEKVRALENLLNQPISAAIFHEMALIAGGLNGNHEKSELLKKMLDRSSEENQRISRVLMVVHDMDGEFEKVNLMKKIADRNSVTEDDWVALISEAGRVNNDFEKSNLLTHIAGRMPRTENIQSAYTKAAKTINSEMEYGRALKASE